MSGGISAEARSELLRSALSAVWAINQAGEEPDPR